MKDQKLLSVEGPIATLTIENPPLNILTDEIRWSIYRTTESLRLDQSVRVLIVRGSGDRAFSVGSDLKGFPMDETGIGGREKVTFEQRMNESLRTLPQVTLAALSGYVLGGGSELALACDVRVASDTVKMGFPEINIGAFSGCTGTQRLLQLIGPAKAMELMFFGEPVDAPEALRLGLVNRVVSRDRVWNEADEWARKLVEKPWLALRAIKECIGRGLEPGYQLGLQAEVEQSSAVYRSDDIREGLAAFKEKRDPTFRHR